jgi:hypothetical protein
LKLCKPLARRKAEDLRTLLEFQNMLIWIIYFWLIAILVGVSAIGRFYLFFTREIVTGYDLVESLISLIAIVGLYGFVYRTPIVTPTFWKVIWVLLMLTWIWSFFGAKNAEMIEKLVWRKARLFFTDLNARRSYARRFVYLQFSFRSIVE